jgi:ribonuclease D
MPDFELITTQDRLDVFCVSALTQPLLYLDTEFVRTRTLKPKLGLLQAYDGVSVVLIDPLADINLDEFWSLLTNQNITKVLHSCSEDLEVFKCYGNGQPSPLFDTQVAASFLGDGPSLGYAPLAKKLLDIHIDKGESRTNWVARPLSDSQLEYASKDVLYLKPLYETLKDRLEQQGIYDYVTLEGELAVAKRCKSKPVEDIYLDIKGAWRLMPKELAVLKRLAGWRQLEAEKRDLALNFVVKEANLITIAKNNPQSLSQLRQLPDILPQEVRYHGQAILDNVQQVAELGEQELPARIVRLVDYAGYKQAYKNIRQAVEQAAEQINIPVEAIASKRQVNQVLSWLWKLDDEAREIAFRPDLLQGWRHEVVGVRLLEQQKTES